MKSPKRPRRRVKPGSFAELIRDYMASPEFCADPLVGLAKGTRVNYAREFGILELPNILGAYPASEVRPALVQQVLDAYAKAGKFGKQGMARSALLSLQKWGRVRDRCGDLCGGVRVVGTIQGHLPWSPEQVELGIAAASTAMSRFIALAAYLGQRGGDIVAMRWADLDTYRGRTVIRVVQQKTGRDLWIPFDPALLAIMATWDRSHATLNSCPGAGIDYLIGEKVTGNVMSSRWIRELRKPELAPLRGLHLHGLRATCVVRYRNRGFTVPEIERLVGMSLHMVSRYSKNSDQRDDVVAAFERLEIEPESRQVDGQPTDESDPSLTLSKIKSFDVR